ncbi:MAG: retropepsin-like aspartic protease [Sarcina sp.]
MVNFEFKYGLLFCSIDVMYKGCNMQIDNILIDTGSGGTILKMDLVEEIGITIEVTDSIECIQGVGGNEFVYKKSIDKIGLGELFVENLKVEIGVMDYGFEINGILGIDFLQAINAVIDLNELTITSTF